MREGVFSAVHDNEPLDGLTISHKVDSSGNAYFFSLGRGTDISEEHYLSNKFILLLKGHITIYSSSLSIELENGDGIITRSDLSFGVKAIDESVYLEVDLGRDSMVNEKVKEGNIFALKDLVPFELPRTRSTRNLDSCFSGSCLERIAPEANPPQAY